MLLILSTATACGSPVAPSRSVAAPTGSSAGVIAGLPGRPIALGQTVEADLDAVSNAMCDFGNDPYPCARYVIDLPRAGKVVVRMDFDGSPLPMFIAFETATSHASRSNFVATGGSPLAGSFAAPAGQLTIAVGVDAPYVLRAMYRYRFVTTLE
jgi:hypothetical protein